MGDKAAKSLDGHFEQDARFARQLEQTGLAERVLREIAHIGYLIGEQQKNDFSDTSSRAPFSPRRVPAKRQIIWRYLLSIVVTVVDWIRSEKLGDLGYSDSRAACEHEEPVRCSGGESDKGPPGKLGTAK